MASHLVRNLLRSVAGGKSVANAVSENALPTDGAQLRVEQWRQMRAREYGMTAQMWDMLHQDGVTDLLVNGDSAWLDYGEGLVEAPWHPESEAHARTLAVHMAAAAGKRLDEASPMADGFIGNHIRLHAVLPPLATPATLISLRVLRQQSFTLRRLVELGMVSADLEELLRMAVESRFSVLISGPTGSGKTTLLGALLGLVPSDERIICIEEVRELDPVHPHVVHLQERQANIEGSGHVTLTDLVRASLRMRPDRIVLGECRGPEVREVLTAMNTGHSGGFATLHANSVADVPARLIALGSLAQLSEAAVRDHTRAGFQMVLQVGRGDRGKRIVKEVGVFGRGERLECLPVLVRSRGSMVPTGHAGLLEELLGCGA